jgi:peptidoglycan hydrolase CwlO-like protein
MENITVPPPEEIQQRIADCEQELKSLRQLFRLSQAIRDAKEARQRRARSAQEGGVLHAR